MSDTETSGDCFKCSKETGEDLIGCDRWLHYSCAGYLAAEVNRIDLFYCQECEDKGEMTLWKREEATHRQKQIKASQYFEVKRIVDDRERNGKRQFLVEWTDGTTHETRVRSWEPEDHLDGAIDFLQKYCRTAQIELSSIKGLCGSTNLEASNRDNWVDMKTIQKEFARIRKEWHLKDTLKVTEYSGLGTEDGIYFLNYNFHCFVLMYLHDGKTAYIADGQNQFATDIETAREINGMIDAKLISCKYMQQRRIDHCASTAVLIAASFLRMYNKKDFETNIVVSAYWINQLTRKLHPAPSEPANNPDTWKCRCKFTCIKCGKTFKGNQALNMHKIRTHK